MKIITNFLNKEIKIDFLAKRKLTFTLAIAFVLISIGSYIVKGMNYGIDFNGGVLIEARSYSTFDMSKLRSEINSLDNVNDVDIQAIGEDNNEVMIRALANDENQQIVVNEIKSVLGDDIDYRRVEMVGPKVGSDLKKASITAAILAIFVISLYIWFRFELPFALGAFLSTAHDVILTFGLFSLFGLDFNLTIVAAIMMLAGYSINDTVVSYDRMRENIKNFRKLTVYELINKSINDTLSRTTLTSFTTLIAAVVLYFIGGEALRGFSIALTFGIVIGTFSSIFIAMPILLFFDVKKMGEEKVVQPDFNR